MKKNLAWYDFVTINLFWLGMNIRNTSVGSILLPYLVDSFVNPQVKNSALGAISTAGLVIAMLVQPAAGLWSDRSGSRFGRRRPFIFVGVLFDVIFLIAIGLSGSFGMLLVVSLFQQFSANISHGPLQGLIPDLVPEEQRGKASGVKALMELLPLILVAFTVAKLVGAGQIGWAIFATCAGLVITMLLTLVFVKEQPLSPEQLRELRGTPFWPPMLRVLGVLAGIALGALAGLLGGGAIGGLAGLLTRAFTGAQTAWGVAVGLGGMAAMAVAVIAGVWGGAIVTLGQDARRNAPFTWWMVNRLMFMAAITSIQGFTPFFLMYAFGLTREEAANQNGSLIMVVGLFTLVTALLGGWLADRAGRRALVAISGLISAAGAFLLLTTVWVPNFTFLYLIGGILGLGTGLFMAVSWALGTDLVPAGEAGRYLGISNLAGAGAGMIGKGIGGPVADYLNQIRPGLGYFAIFACYGVLFLLSIAALAGVKKPRAG